MLHRLSVDIGQEFAVDDVELANIVANASDGPVKIGLLDEVLANAINSDSNRMVVLSGYTFEKERFTHPNILFSDYHLISLAMRQGYAVINPLRPKHLIIGFIPEDRGGKPFKLALKATRDNSGIHVETFHRIDRSEFGRLLRQAVKRNGVIRNPYPELEKR